MNDRRLLLTRLAKLLVLIGLGFVLYPFLAALAPDRAADAEREHAWDREVDLTTLKLGELLLIDDWPGGPVAIYHRSPHEIDALVRVRAQLHDPDSQSSRQPDELRSDRRAHSAPYFVFVPMTTGRACQVRSLPANKQPKPDIDWYGGFVDPCSGALYDSAGRVYARYRPEREQNLTVPYYVMTGADRIRLSVASRD